MSPEFQPILLLIVILVVEFFLGFGIVKERGPIWLCWAFPLGAVTIIHIYSSHASSQFRMIALILVLLTGMKVVMARHYPNLTFNLWKWFLYCFTWVGMNPEIFFKRREIPDPRLLHRGATFFVIGLIILLVFRLSNGTPFPPQDIIVFYGLSLILLIAFSMMLHFGLLNISAWILQWFKYPAYSLFREPLKAESLRDFWGKRWNLAFTEMTSVLIFRPLSKTQTATFALALSFIFSGLLHEVALSIPVGRGYGLPTLYFIIQFLLIIAEEKVWKRKPGKLWVILSLVLPLPLLFNAYNLPVFWQLVLKQDYGSTIIF
jgi:hypothetical protein